MRRNQDSPDTGGTGGLRALWPAILLALAGLLGLAAVQLSAADCSGQYLVIAAPWLGRAEMAEMIGRADGGVAGFGGLPSVVIAMANAPDFQARMREQGAWLVVPSPRLAGCAVTVTVAR